MKRINTYLLPVLIAFFFGGCDEEVTPDADLTAELIVSFDVTVGTEPYEQDKVYQDNSGRQFIFTAVRYYISDVTLIRKDGSEKVFSNKFYLGKPELDNDNFFVDEIEPGDYAGIRFNVGIDGLSNNLYYPGSPNLPSDSPLQEQPDINMFWDRVRGYKFIVLEGLYDDSPSGTMTPDEPFSYQIGSDELLRSISFMREIKLEAGLNLRVNMAVDLLNFVKDIDFLQNPETATFDNPALATALANKVPTVFKLATSEL